MECRDKQPSHLVALGGYLVIDGCAKCVDELLEASGVENIYIDGEVVVLDAFLVEYEVNQSSLTHSSR